MVTGNNSHQEDGDRQQPAAKGGGATRSWGTTVSGQSVSTSGSVGSPSQSMATPASDSTFLRLNHLDIHGDDAGSQGAVVGGKKKKRGQRAGGGDKSGRGLRQFSMKVCEKVESKGRTTYNEVADELVAEFADPSNSLATPDQQQYDEKNIRRRVYDALNVLMAMDIISKDKKEIQWKGLPRTSLNDIEELKAERLGLRNRIEKKTAYLQELEDQFVGLQNLIQRNERLYSSGNAPSGGVALPFILVQDSTCYMKCIKEETKKLECYLLVQHLIWISSVTMGYKSISLARFLGKVGRNVEMKAIICDNSLHFYENPSVLVIIVYFASTPLCLLLNNLLCRVLVAHRVLNCNPSQILQVFVALYLLVDILDPLTWLAILRKKSSGDLTRN